MARAQARQKSTLRIYRAATRAAAVRSRRGATSAYLPRQLLVFGRGYLPNAREVELPMGEAPAQSYVYSGPTSSSRSNAARRARRRRASLTGGTFAFSWGMQEAASGNEAYSIGIYELRPAQIKKAPEGAFFLGEDCLVALAAERRAAGAAGWRRC